MTWPIKAWERISIFGVTQSGKSTLVHFLLRRLSRYVIYDVKWEYSGLGVIVHTIDTARHAILSHVGRIIMQPTDMSVAYFDAFCAMLCRCYRAGVFIVEEVQMFAANNQISSHFKWLITTGQGMQFRIGVWSVSQRPQIVDKLPISQATHVISFRMSSPLDQKALCTYIDEKTLSSLPLHNFAWHYVPAQKTIVCPPIKP